MKRNESNIPHITKLNGTMIMKPLFDFNGDGVVDIRNLVKMQNHLADNTVPLGKQEINAQQKHPTTKIANLPSNKQTA